MESMTEPKIILPLTDENQRLVNLNLLKKVKEYKRGGITGVHRRLDPSNIVDEKGNLQKVRTMERAIERDYKKLHILDGKPKELHQFLEGFNRRKKRLQIRITNNHFLLNNILCILGMRYEDLFDKNQLPGQAELSTNINGISDELEESMDTILELKKINTKLDTIIFNYSGEKIRKNTFARFYDLCQCIFSFRDLFIPYFYKPEDYGFSFLMKNDDRQKLSSETIYERDYLFVYSSINLLHKRHKIHSLFDK